MTPNSFKKGFAIMVLKQRFLNDCTENLMLSNSLKSSTVMILKSLKGLLNDGTKKVP